MVISTDYRIFAFGKNCHGMLGIPQYVEQNILTPQQVVLKLDKKVQVEDISLGNMHTMILLTDGSILTCGNVNSGILGITGISDKLEFFRKIEDYTFYETKNEDIRDQLSITTFNSFDTNFALKSNNAKSNSSIVFISCSYYNSAFITNLGDLHMCGENKLIPLEELDNEIEMKKRETTTTKGQNNDRDPVWQNKIFPVWHAHVICNVQVSI